jgi:hypothetical protein
MEEKKILIPNFPPKRKQNKTIINCRTLLIISPQKYTIDFDKTKKSSVTTNYTRYNRKQIPENAKKSFINLISFSPKKRATRIQLENGKWEMGKIACLTRKKEKN